MCLTNEFKKTLRNAVAQVLCLFLKDRILIREARKAPEGTWVIGIELICVYYIYGSKKHKVQVRKGIWKALSLLKGGYKNLCAWKLVVCSVTILQTIVLEELCCE